MDEEHDAQQSNGNDWERVDARILGQLLAAQNLLFVLPDEARIETYFAQALSGIPGVTSCIVCLGDVPASTVDELCAECLTFRRGSGESLSIPYNFSCPLAARGDARAIKVGTNEHTFGFFVFRVESDSIADPYWPFLNNLANYVALSLENRMQKLLLEKARDELESKVQFRTEELLATNARLEMEVQERKNAEENLKQLNERFILATHAARLGVWDWDIQKNQLVWDDRMYELYGIKRDSFLGAYEAWLHGIHPEDRARSNEISQLAQRGECDYDTEFRVVWPDASVHFLKAYGQMVWDSAGNPSRMIGINLDITEHKQAEEEIRRLNQELENRVAMRTAQLEAANKELETFAYSVSHDLRAPLRHIDGFLGLLQKRLQPNLDAESQRYISTISGATVRMATLIDDLLSFSRTGRSKMTKTEVDPEGLVRDVISEFEPETRGRDIHWKIGPLPHVMADLPMLRMVFSNLISNALKFTRNRSPVEIEIGCLPDHETEVVLFVRDNGAGFDMKYVDKLFGVFQRLHSVEEFEGTGIGLANVRQVINRHGGRTWAEGKENGGATFFVSLPYSPEGGDPRHDSVSDSIPREDPSRTSGRKQV